MKVLSLKNIIIIFSIMTLTSQHTSLANDNYQKFTKYNEFITTNEMIPYFMDSLSNNSYLFENGYQIVPQSGRFNYPGSTIVVTGFFIMTGGSAAAAAISPGYFFWGTALALTTVAPNLDPYYHGSNYNFFHNAGWGTLLGTFAGRTASFNIPGIVVSAIAGGIVSVFGIDDTYNFYQNRLKFQSNLLDKSNRPVDVSCLAFFAYNQTQHTLVTEYDACYLTVITGQENTPIIRIPQTVDGLVRLDDTTPIIGSLDDWVQGQTKVVDAFTISLE